MLQVNHPLLPFYLLLKTGSESEGFLNTPGQQLCTLFQKKVLTSCSSNLYTRHIHRFTHTHFSFLFAQSQNTFRRLIREQCLALAAGSFSMLIISPVGPSVWQCWWCATVVRFEPAHTAPWEMRTALQSCR